MVVARSRERELALKGAEHELEALDPLKRVRRAIAELATLRGSNGHGSVVATRASVNPARSRAQKARWRKIRLAEREAKKAKK